MPKNKAEWWLLSFIAVTCVIIGFAIAVLLQENPDANKSFVHGLFFGVFVIVMLVTYTNELVKKG